MSIIGTWKISKIMVFGADFKFTPKTVDEIMALEDTEENEEYKKMTSTVARFTEDNVMILAMKIPAEMIEEAKAEGAPLTDDGLVIIQQKPWKEENGEYFYDTGDTVEINGVPQSSFAKLAFDENGCLMLNDGMMVFEKV